MIRDAPNLEVWVCTKGNCCKCIFMLCYMHDHHGMIVSIHVSLWHWFSHVYNMHQHVWHFDELRLTLGAVYIGVKPCWCVIAHQTQNSAWFLLWKWGTFVVVFLPRKLGESSVLCTMTHLKQNAADIPQRKQGEMLPDFHCGNLATIPNVLAKRW